MVHRLSLILCVALAGCATHPTADHPNPTCSSEAQCAAKMATARHWLLAHNYSVQEHDGGIYAGEGQILVGIEPSKDGEIPVTIKCLPDLMQLLGFTAGCKKERYDVLYDLTQAMNESE